MADSKTFDYKNNGISTDYHAMVFKNEKWHYEEGSKDPFQFGDHKHLLPDQVDNDHHSKAASFKYCCCKPQK